MSEATVSGQVHLIEPTKSFGQKGFRKRTVVLEQVTGRFTNYLPLEFIADSCDMVDNLSVGDTIKVTYRLGWRNTSGAATVNAVYGNAGNDTVQVIFDVSETFTLKIYGDAATAGATDGTADVSKCTGTFSATSASSGFETEGASCP